MIIWRNLIISNFITEGRALLIIAVSILSAFITNLNSQSTEMTDPPVSGAQYFLAPEGNDAVIDARIVRNLVPGIKLLHTFEFCTYGQTVICQKFWFDDFAIRP